MIIPLPDKVQTVCRAFLRPFNAFSWRGNKKVLDTMQQVLRN